MPLLSTLAAVVPAAINGVKKVVNWVKDKKVGQGIGKIAPTVAQTAASIMTNKTNRKYAEKQYNTNMEAYWKQWDAQNAYNSPAAQMERYKEAGLNPHLIYGQGSPGLAANVSTPQMNYEAVNPMNFGNVQNSMMYSSNLDKINAQVEQYRTNIIKQNLDIQYLDKSMADRLALLKQEFNSEWNRDNRSTAQFVAWARLNGFTVDTYQNSNGMNTFDWNRDHEFISLVEKAFDAALQRTYASTDAIDKDNALRDLKIELEKNGISSTSTDVLNTLLRIYTRFTGLDIKTLPKF